MTRPVISVTPAGRKVTAGSQRFAAAVNKVLAAISKDPSDINTGTPSISRVNTVVTNFSKDISRIHVSEAPIISPQLIILVIGCIVVSVTAASCVTFIIVYKRRKRDHNSHTTAVASPPEVDRPSHTEAPPTDIFSTDYLTPVAADSNYEDEEHIYHELHTIYDTFKATSRDSGDYLKLTNEPIVFFILKSESVSTNTKIIIAVCVVAAVVGIAVIIALFIFFKLRRKTNDPSSGDACLPVLY
ncbi:hypothetical protein C0Q70_04209, partial [Pomacea canaliculata]